MFADEDELMTQMTNINPLSLYYVITYSLDI